MNKAQALYIHIPFCSYLCDYCDFTKLQYFSTFIIPYLDSLKKEIEHYHIDSLKTIYVGGGTPTSLSNDELKILLEIIKPYLKGVREYTFEANPDSLTKDKLELLYSYGVNRLSIGVQTSDDSILKNVNRHHSFEDARRVISLAREIGFKNINVDIILGLQNNLDKLKEDITKIVSLNVEHISCYSLTVHPHTVFFQKGKRDLDDDIARTYYDYVSSKLKENGYLHYEVSNYAKEGYYSKHNLVYWKDERYYGVGLGASGYLDNVRYTNTRNLTTYLKGEYIAEQEEIDLEDDKFYFAMLNLRTIFGLSFKKYFELFNEDFYLIKKNIIDQLINQKLLYIENDTLKATYEGLMTLDRVLLTLFE